MESYAKELESGRSFHDLVTWTVEDSPAVLSRCGRDVGELVGKLEELFSAQLNLITSECTKGVEAENAHLRKELAKLERQLKWRN